MESIITVKGQKVRDAMKELGITQEELAQRLDMKRETLNRKINGQANWTFKDLNSLTKVLGKDLNYFLDL